MSRSPWKIKAGAPVPLAEIISGGWRPVKNEIPNYGTANKGEKQSLTYKFMLDNKDFYDFVLSFNEGVHYRPKATKPPTSTQDSHSMPSYTDLVKVVEDLTALNELLKEKLAQTEDECRQLRQLTNPVNGMKDRAKKALVHAERTLKLYD